MENKKYNSECIFCKITSGEVFKNGEDPIVIPYEDDKCMVFKTTEPEAPTHLLIVPKHHLDRLSSAKVEDELMLGHLLNVSAILSKKFNLPDYKIKINNGEKAGQTVFHLHIHFMSEKSYK